MCTRWFEWKELEWMLKAFEFRSFRKRKVGFEYSCFSSRLEKLTIDVWIFMINTDLISSAKLKAIKSPIKRIFMINVDLISSVNNKKSVKL